MYDIKFIKSKVLYNKAVSVIGIYVNGFYYFYNRDPFLSLEDFNNFKIDDYFFSTRFSDILEQAERSIRRFLDNIEFYKEIQNNLKLFIDNYNPQEDDKVLTISRSNAIYIGKQNGNYFEIKGYVELVDKSHIRQYTQDYKLDESDVICDFNSIFDIMVDNLKYKLNSGVDHELFIKNYIFNFSKINKLKDELQL